MTDPTIPPTPTGTYQPGLWEKITTVVVAVLVVGLVGWLLIRNEPPDPNLFILARIIISLAVAVLGATIPGFLNVGWSGQGIAIRAGGALALFLVTFFGSPKVIPTSSTSSSRNDKEVEDSLKHFSIERPEDKQELPLTRGRSGPLVGKFPIDNIKDEAKRREAQVTFQVFKLPEGEEIPQNVGPVRPSVSGLWSFDRLTFAGEGSYRIVARASVRDKYEDNERIVKCTEKPAATLQGIKRGREARNAKELVPSSRENVTKTRLERIESIAQLQEPMIRNLEQRNYSEALNVFEKAMDLIDPVLAVFPDDLKFQLYRGYFLKNYAMVKDEYGQNDPAEFDRALKEADRVFQAIIAQDENNAAAWNGIGSVLLVRREPEKALPYIDKALEIDSNYQEAKRDRQLALDMMKQEKTLGKE